MRPLLRSDGSSGFYTVLEVWRDNSGWSGPSGVSACLLLKKGNLMARMLPVFWKNPSFSGNSGARAYA